MFERVRRILGGDVDDFLEKYRANDQQNGIPQAGDPMDAWEALWTAQKELNAWRKNTQGGVAGALASVSDDAIETRIREAAKRIVASRRKRH